MNLDQTGAGSTEAVPTMGIPSATGRGRFGKWFERHPLLAIVVVAVLAVTISSYPIIFCGKSFVSPACVPSLVYDGSPVLPGLTRLEHPPSDHQSDTGAAMWWGVPLGFLESRCLLDYGELPLWDRYGHSGEMLLGQAVSMLGDPLQLIVILGRGSAMAWDVKFLAAKLLFCVGFGWLVQRLLASQGLALIYTALGAWCGAFIFIYNHTAFFMLAYAPWILLSAQAMLARPETGRTKWGLVWLVANVSCFSAGHVEPATALIGGLNFAALASSLASRRGFAERAGLLACMGGGTLLFLGLTAPVWITFLTALPQAFSAHQAIIVTQESPADFLGMFDDFYYHYPIVSKKLAPGTSFLVLAGCLFSVLRWRQLRCERFFWINTGAIVFWGACVFGLIPAALIAMIPLENRVGHVNSDLSYLLVIHLTLQSAYGFKSLLTGETFRQSTAHLWVVTVIMVLMLAHYTLAGQNLAWSLRQYVALSFAGAVGAPAMYKYLQARNGRVRLLGWTAIILLGFIPNYRFGLYNSGNDLLVILPGPRTVLNPSCPTLEQFKSGGDPFRVTGLRTNLNGNYSAVYGLENIQSCAPLSNGKYIELIRNFPGVSMPEGCWFYVDNPSLARPLLNLLNVKYLLASPHLLPPGSNQFTIHEFDDFSVLENKQLWPRAFFASQVVPVSSNDEFTRHLLQHAEQPFVALDRGQADHDPELRRLETETSPAIVPAEHYQLLPNSTTFDIQTTGAGVVCLTEGQADDFLARANGEPVKVLTVNRAFKGIYLAKPGNYHVEFRYRPHFWGISLTLFCTSAGILLILGAIEFMRARQPRLPMTI